MGTFSHLQEVGYRYNLVAYLSVAIRHVSYFIPTTRSSWRSLTLRGFSPPVCASSNRQSLRSSKGPPAVILPICTEWSWSPIVIRVSMSRKGTFYDNAVMERFFGTLKEECVTRVVLETAEQAQHVFSEYGECFYNRIRRHSSLGYLSAFTEGIE
jgi:transposase InsO family protein